MILRLSATYYSSEFVRHSAHLANARAASEFSHLPKITNMYSRAGGSYPGGRQGSAGQYGVVESGRIVLWKNDRCWMKSNSTAQITVHWVIAAHGSSAPLSSVFIVQAFREQFLPAGYMRRCTAGIGSALYLHAHCSTQRDKNKGHGGPLVRLVRTILHAEDVMFRVPPAASRK